MFRVYKKKLLTFKEPSLRSHGNITLKIEDHIFDTQKCIYVSLVKVFPFLFVFHVIRSVIISQAQMSKKKKILFIR